MALRSLGTNSDKIATGTTAQRPTLTAQDAGNIRFNTETNTLEQWTGTEWTEAGGGASVTIGDTPPASPAEGDLWWNSDDGRLYVWYEDANTNQWVDTNPNSGDGVSVDVSENPPFPASPVNEGSLWFNDDLGRLFISYTDATDVGVDQQSQWIDAAPAAESSVDDLQAVTDAGNTTTRDVVSGGNPDQGANNGSRLNATGLVQASRTGATGQVWGGFLTGTTAPTSRINADGSSEFAGVLTVDRPLPGGGFGPEDQNALLIESASTCNAKIVADGSVKIGGTLSSTTSGPAEQGNITLNADGNASFVGNITLATAGSGVVFQAGTPGAGQTITGNTLDDYEEGTWTPGPITGNVSFANTFGKYTKIGRVVYFECQFNVTTTSTGISAHILGLPFVVSSNAEQGFIPEGQLVTLNPATYYGGVDPADRYAGRKPGQNSTQLQAITTNGSATNTPSGSMTWANGLTGQFYNIKGWYVTDL